MKIYCQKILLLAALCLLGAPSNALLRAQNVIGGTTPNSPAEPEVQNATEGMTMAVNCPPNGVTWTARAAATAELRGLR